MLDKRILTMIEKIDNLIFGARAFPRTPGIRVSLASRYAAITALLNWANSTAPPLAHSVMSLRPTYLFRSVGSEYIMKYRESCATSRKSKSSCPYRWEKTSTIHCQGKGGLAGGRQTSPRREQGSQSELPPRTHFGHLAQHPA